MRIIAGEHRSRRILGPEGDLVTRPITDRAKQNLFDRLASHGLLDGGNVLDIFSGTGSLGLEALSRGMAHCTFVERDRLAADRLEQNLGDLRLAERATVLRLEAMSAGWISTLRHLPLSITFCDPPYSLTDDPVTRPTVLQLIASLASKTEPYGVAVLRTDKAVEAEPVEGWEEPARVEVGSMAFHFYQVPGEEETESDVTNESISESTGD